MTRKLPFTPEPFAMWPAEVQKVWLAAVATRSWRNSFANDVRRSYADFRGWRRQLIQTETAETIIKSYAETLLVHLTPKSAVSGIVLLTAALAITEPMFAGPWLIAFCRNFRKLHTRTPADIGFPPRQCASTYGLPVEEWPEDLRTAWKRARQPHEGRRYRDRANGSEGLAAKWTPDYAARVQRGFGLYLRFARDQSLPPAPTVEGIARFIAVVRERVSSVSVASYVWEIYAASIVILPSGKDEWSWLRQEADWLRDVSRPSRNKEARIVPISRLRRLALRLLNEVDRCPLSVSAALDYRDALMVLQLTFKPIRISNLAEMRFDYNLILRDDGGSLFFARTKNGASDGHAIPPELAKRFRRYRDHYRSAIAGATETDQVWVSKLGGKLTGRAISQIIGDLTLQQLKRRVNPHLFRDCVATSIAEQGPENIESAGVLLGQRDRRSLETYRRHAQSTQAAAHLEQLLDPYRRRPSARCRPI
jgi:integrase/recombinase XerD